MHPHTATLWLNRSGVNVRPNKVGISPDRVLEAVDLRENGWSWKKLGDRYGCSHTAARRAILKHYATQQTADDNP